MPAFFWLDVVALAAAAVVVAALALLVLGAGLSRALNRFFLLYVLLQLAWVIASLLLRLSLGLRRGDPELLVGLIGLSYGLLGPPLLLFAAEFVQRRTRTVDWAALAGLGVLAALTPAIFAGRLFLNPRLLPNGTTVIDFSPGGLFASTLPAVFFLWSMLLFWRARQRIRERYLVLSILVLLAGFVFGAVANIPVPLSSFTQTASIVLLGYAVVSRQLFNPLRERTAALTHEVTERRKTEEALRESEERFRTIFDSVNDAIMVHDYESGAILDVNRRTCEMYGHTHDEACALGVGDLSSGDPPYTQAEAEARIRKAAAGEPQTFEWRARARDGSLFWVEVGMRRATLGAYERVLVTVRDTSERKRAEEERRQLQMRIQHTQRVEGLGLLAGGIAHDFNNLLCGVLGFAEIALTDVPPDSRAADRLRRIRDTAQRAAGLCRQLLAYAGRGQRMLEAVNLSRLLGERADLIRASVAPTAELRFDLADDLPAIEADPAQITQAALNLIINASEALPERGGRVLVTTQRLSTDRPIPGDPYVGHDLPPGEYVALGVNDNGCGMDEEMRGRLFDPFFTTKFTGRGLGLSAVLGIAHAHGGTVQVESQPGTGSTFVVLLPASARLVGPRETPVAETTSGKGGGVILLIDDEPAVREATAAMLQALGFEVVTAADGPAGLEALRARSAQVTAVLLDVSMPGMGGEEALAGLRAVRPDVRVVLVSGHDRGDVADRFAGCDLAGILQKPFSLATLEETLRTALAPQPTMNA